MGMYAVLHAVSDSNIKAILATPELIGYITFKEDPEAIWEFSKSEKRSFLSRFFGKKPEPQKVTERPKLVLTEAEQKEIDLDKAWHGLHYCLTQDIGEGSHPLGFILYGGQLAGDIDLGYGPARLFTSSETADINAKLQAVSSEGLKANYDPTKMDDVYPSVIWSRTDEDNFEYINAYFSDLKRFLGECVREKVGMTVGIY
jgi:hypothetical protein